jgi:hypothetical protein
MSAHMSSHGDNPRNRRDVRQSGAAVNLPRRDRPQQAGQRRRENFVGNPRSGRAEDRSLDPLGAQVDGFAGEVGGSDAASEAFARLEDGHGATVSDKLRSAAARPGTPTPATITEPVQRPQRTVFASLLTSLGARTSS